MKIPINLQKKFIFNLGVKKFFINKDIILIFIHLFQTAYLVKGNLLEATKTFKEFFNSKLTSDLEGLALNNIAVAYWWRKNPNFRDLSDSETESEVENLKEVNKKHLNLFKFYH